jgi:hypothetical protein
MAGSIPELLKLLRIRSGTQSNQYAATHSNHVQ